MVSRHCDPARQMYNEQSEHPRFDPVVIAVAACKHPNRKMVLAEAKAIAFAWRELREAAEKNSRLDRSYDAIRKHIGEAMIELNRVTDISTIEDYNPTWKPHTKEEFNEIIRVLASWILRQVFVIEKEEPNAEA